MTEKHQPNFDDHPNPREQPEYIEGNRAFNGGKKDSENPHIVGLPRLSWFTGYYDARTNYRLGHIFKKYGLTFP